MSVLPIGVRYRLNTDSLRRVWVCRWTRTFLLAVLLTAARPGAALPPNLGLAQIQHTAWSCRQGAPADIWALAQSPDGFLLLGTGSGLYRFDGVTFEHIIPSNQSELGFRDITALLALPSGEIWIGYYAGGVSVLKNGALTNYGRREGVPSGWITSFARESDGTLWVAAREGLGRFSAGRWETVSADWNFPGHQVHWVLLDTQGTLWVAGGTTVTFLPRGSHKFEDTGVRSSYKSTLALAPDGTVWLASESISPRPLMRRELPATRAESRPELDPVKRLVLDRDGSIWATDSVRGGIYRATQREAADSATPHTNAPEFFTEAEGLTSDRGVPLLEDQEGNIWVGTRLGLNRFRATRFVREWRVPSSSQMGYSLAAAPNGSVWIASDEQLFEAHGSRCDLVARLPSPIRSAYREPGGALWLGTHEGLVEWANNEMRSLPLPAPAQPTQYQYVHAITADGSQDLWISAVDRGLLRLHDRRWELAGSGLNSPDATPTTLWTDAQQRQWLGYGDGTAALREGDSTRVFGPDQGLRVGPITVIRGSTAAIFAAGEWGLARFDGHRFQSLSAARSDAFSGITGIIIRANGDTWLNGNRGVLHMSSEAMNDAYDHPQAKLHYDLFDVQDGLPGYAQQGEDASAVAGADGRLWFATNHGIAWIDPDHLFRNRIPPHVVIRSVLADQRTYQSSGPIELPESTRSVRIDYTAPSLAAPERVRFRYKLDGADDTWRDAGNERSVRYANLRPGRYTFRVIASNNDGVWNNVGATVAFVLHPAFYQTSWFLALVFGACLGVLWALYRLRLHSISEARARARRLRELQTELAHAGRLATLGQLTASIAHEVNQPVAAMMTSAQAALRWLRAQPPALGKLEETLGRIVSDSKRASDVIGRVRSLVKKERPRNEPIALNEAILEVIAMLSGEALKQDVSVQLDLAENLPTVLADRVQLQQVVLNLCMNAIEALRGIEDRPRQMLIRTQLLQSREILVCIADSGPGLPPQRFADLYNAFETTKPGGLGLGLSICQSIIESHGGKLWATPNEPHGTVFQFTLAAAGGAATELPACS